jgi:hypothetical protein
MGGAKSGGDCCGHVNKMVEVTNMDNTKYVPSSEPLRKWREQAEKFEDEKRAALAELKAEEERRTGEAQSRSPEAWNVWLFAALSQHLANHPVLDARFEGAGQAIGELVAELRGRLDANDVIQNRQREEIRNLQIECAELRVKVAELRTDQVLASMPGLNTSRSAVN